ncbi:M48 family metallopeptidase [Helicovermis profundi]|uniref:YgjP-like metallopeptidase domain-containing protein n=1 Tax=Helicovermis profundi TaxID=3065157 RepID=A0AAU9E5D4_9FIRM|nr:hypothetical protein HLPR_22070 [Clostridia bacterium S502]
MKKLTENKYYYLGNVYPMYMSLDKSLKKVTIKWVNNSFHCASPFEGEIDISLALKSFYIKESRKVINQRLKIYQKNFKVKYKSFLIEDNDKRWGSCNSLRSLTFNWRLMIFPLDVVDYVVVHELCHMLHMNHDRSFWRLVGKICPNYKKTMEILGTKKTRDM